MAATMQDIRQEFPGLQGRTYLNTAAGSCSPQAVADAVRRYADEKLQGAMDPHEMSGLVDGCRAGVAALLHCRPQEIAFLSSTTEAINTILFALPWRPGENLVITDLEFPSSIIAAARLREHAGTEIRFVRHQQGRVPVGAMAERIDARTRLVLTSHVSYRSGYRCDLQALGEAAHDRGALVLVDASQAAGAVDVHAPHVDFVAACTRKWLLATHGLAFLYCKQSVIDCLRPLYTGWRGVQDFRSIVQTLQFTYADDASRFESGLLDYAGVYGLQAALEFLDRVGMAAIEERVLRLSGALVAGLHGVGVTPLTPQKAGERAGIVSFETPRYLEIAQSLKSARVEAWCKDGRVRLSPHFYNTHEEVEQALAIIAGATV